MNVVSAIIDSLDILFVEAEIFTDLFGPEGDEVVLGHVVQQTNFILPIEAVMHVFIHVTFVALCTQVKEVGHDLGNLPAVIMVVKREGADLEADSLHTSNTIDDFRLKSILHLRIGHHGIVAEQIDEDLNFDIELVTTLDPAWVCSIDRDTV